jgi:predicted GNAT family acetyltransferase
MSIEHDQEKKLFYTEIEGDTAYLSYQQIDDETLDYVSTYVPDELRGRGLAGRLARTALDYAQEHNYGVRPSCSFVAKFLDKHPEYASLRR